MPWHDWSSRVPVPLVFAAVYWPASGRHEGTTKIANVLIPERRVSRRQTGERFPDCPTWIKLPRTFPPYRFHPTLNTGPDELSEKLNFSRAEGQRKLMPQATQPIDSRISAVCPVHQDARKGQLRRPTAVRVQLTLSNLSVFPATSIVLADVNTPRPRKMCFTKSLE